MQQSSPADERRDLIVHVLKDYVRRGGRLVGPTSQNFQNPAVLDAVHVASLLAKLALASVPLDLSACSVQQSGGLQHMGVDAHGVTSYNFTPGDSNGGRVSDAGDNPFAVASSSSTSANPFAATINSISNSNLNPFSRPSASKSSGGGAAVRATPNNPMPSRPSPPPPGPNRGHLQPIPTTSVKLVVGPPIIERQQPGAAVVMLDGSFSELHEQAPKLPHLNTGLQKDQLQELAFLVFAATCPAGVSNGGAAPGKGAGFPGSGSDARGSLLTAMRGQLEVDESRSQDLLSVLRHVSTGYYSTTPARRVSMEGLVTMLAAARPSDFHMMGNRGFKGWVRWRDTISTVLRVAGGLRAPEPVAGAGTARESRRLLARLKGALRRMDVRTIQELDEEEYGEAAAALTDAARGLVFTSLGGSVPGSEGPPGVPVGNTGSANDLWATFTPLQGDPAFARSYQLGSTLQPGGGSVVLAASSIGWSLPWALRASVAEALLAALFDNLEESSYIDEASAVQAVLESHVWPALGVSPTLALALNAWTHFKQYVATGDARLARSLKHLMTKLSGTVSKLRLQSTASGKGLLLTTNPTGTAPTPLTVEEEQQADSNVAAEVGRMVVDHLLAKLSDYHATFPAGSEQGLQVMLDTAVSATSARGDSPSQLATMLVEVVRAAVGQQAERTITEHTSSNMSVEQSLLGALAAARDVLAAEATRYAPILRPHLAHQPAVAAATVHRALGARLLPWLHSGVALEPDVVEVLRRARPVNTVLSKTVSDAQQALLAASAAAGPESEGARVAGAVLHALRSCVAWEFDIPTAKAMAQWVSARLTEQAVWVERQLQQERWVPISAQEGCAQSAVEIVKLMLETLDALFDMGLPVGEQPLRAFLGGVDTSLGRYGAFVRDKLCDTSRMVPPLPPITRYKKEIVAKQEADEAALLAASTPGLTAARQRGGAMSALKEMGRAIRAGSTAGGTEGKAFLESVPTVDMHADYAIISKLTTPVLACCIMSLHYLQSRTPSITETVINHWRGPPPGRDVSWVTGSLVACTRFLQDQVFTCCHFLAMKVVFWDNRFAYLESLYRHHVVGGTGVGLTAVAAPYSSCLQPLLEGLNQVLGDTCGAMPDGLRSQFAAQLLRATALAWQRVLLDGGPCRWFIPSDLPALRADLDALQRLFVSDGEGLDGQVVIEVLKPCRRLLLLVALEIGPLLDLLKSAKARGSITLSTPSGPEVFDEGTLSKVLARRPERMGSKVLKKDYKLSRRIKT